MIRAAASVVALCNYKIKSHSFQHDCNQGNHSVVKQPTCFCRVLTTGAMAKLSTGCISVNTFALFSVAVCIMLTMSSGTEHYNGKNLHNGLTRTVSCI